MASSTFLSVLLFTTVLCCASGFEFQVGGSAGWVVPPANQTNMYHEWASHNRFQVGDSIRFKYKKDSVMEVEEEGYKNCNSSHPNMFSNNGNTMFRFDHAGSFYFISGAAGHCQKGQKMIVRVLTQEDSLPDHHHHNSSSAFRHPASPLVPKIVFFVSAFVASYVI
ncbi:mavicyanin-like [Neltuma alba]|uniref:mavicyanin-like n=1 Tax=Neltuma alba TaxID=207710 RepID=UPI0010A531A8|nr:mavicyanin-like [Prosopis alba]